MEDLESKEQQYKRKLEKYAQQGGPRSESDAKDIAIAHAKLILHRKELAGEILDSLLLLSQYPLHRSSPWSASSPAPSDASGFKTHVRLFQPSDYDDLIEERNINELCGYPLCPKSRSKVRGGGKWKLTGRGDIVLREDLEKWCSAACAKRALFVKVQLHETAAWERAGIQDIQIDLLEDRANAESQADQAALDLNKLRLDEQRQAVHHAQILAFERGEHGGAQQAPKVKVSLKEKEVASPSHIEFPASMQDDDHLRVEGYKVNLRR